MAFELRTIRGLRAIVLSAVAVGCAAQGADEAVDDRAAPVLRHEGHDHEEQPAVVDAGVAQAPANCPNTFDAIQSAIFDNRTYGCASAACHGSPDGHIDLRKGFAYDSLLGLGTHAEEDEHAHHYVVSGDAPVVYHGDEPVAHVVPGKPEESVLYDDLRAKVEGTPTQLGGTPMPLGGRALTKDQLKAVELWILAGAPQTGFVAGTEVLCPKVATVDAGR